jgi:hypothetical protein
MSESFIKEEIYRILNIKYESETKNTGVIQKIISNINIKEKAKDNLQKNLSYIPSCNNYGC